MTEVIKGQTHYLELFVTNNAGNPVTGLTITYEVEKSSDDSSVTSGTLTDVGGGIYKTAITINTLGQYRVLYSAPNPYSDEVEFLQVVDPASNDTLLRILGLSQENQRIYDQVYDNFGNMTFARIRIYPTATDVDNDTNVLAEYTFEASYDIVKTNLGIIGQAKNVKVKKV